MTQQRNIWYPGIYRTRIAGEYGRHLTDIPLGELIELVQQRAKQDGEWAIEKGFVRDYEDKMRLRMAFVSDPENIRECAEAYICVRPEELKEIHTVDFLCRSLANVSRWTIR